MDINIKKISLGLRHRRTFRIPEIAGSLIDFVVHDDSSPFNTDVYERTDALLDGRGENKGRILSDASGANSLMIDVDSVILNLETKDINTTLKDIQETYLPYIVKNIHKEFKIENFNRLGIVYEFSLTGTPNHFLSRLTGGKFSTAQSGQFKFGSKEMELKSAVMNGLLDYKNYLIAIGFDEHEMQSKFDYQYYFEPEIKSTGDIDFSGFIKESEQQLQHKFLNWLNDEEQKQS